MEVAGSRKIEPLQAVAAERVQVVGVESREEVVAQVVAVVAEEMVVAPMPVTVLEDVALAT